RERKKLEERVLRARPQMEGSLIKRFTRCGRPGCRCMKGQPHGPFWYLSRRIEGKTRYTYIPKDRAKEVKTLIDRSIEIRKARARIRELTERLDSVLDRIVQSQLIDLTRKDVGVGGDGYDRR
ncbi:MAG: DUF6788 family protein, partial [Bacillota bacterium]